MNRLIKLIVVFVFDLCCHGINAQVHMNFTFDTPYGHNEIVGKYAEINGAKIYYEEYGKGDPLLLIHGNGGDIKSMGNQIDFFKKKYRVIIADNRGQGKSELKTDSLTYNQITEDWDELVRYLGLDSINIVGWSDGGIVALKMGISGKSKIKKLVAMGANLRPDSSAVNAWAVRYVLKEKKMIRDKNHAGDKSNEWNLKKQLVGLLADQPNISTGDLSKIKAKVLVIAGDEDIIRNVHTLEIYEHISQAQLCIMPGETHYAPASSPEYFNNIVDRFLATPFKRPDSDWTKWE